MIPIDPFFTSKVRLKHSTWKCNRQTPIGGRKYVEALYEGKEIKRRRKKRRHKKIERRRRYRLRQKRAVNKGKTAKDIWMAQRSNNSEV